MILAQQYFTSELVEKVILALLGAVLGFVGAYTLDRVKARREPRRRISWDVDIERTLIKVKSSIRSKVRVLYNGAEVAELAHIKCAMANTGNRVVKNHELRFTFPERTTLLETYLEPVPDPELGVELILDEDTGGRSERRYRISHLERGEAVHFNFVTAGGDFADWRPRSFNQEGDVEFGRRDVAVAKEDEEHVRPFVTAALLMLLVPGIVGTFQLEGVSDLAVFVTRIALLAPTSRLSRGLCSASPPSNSTSDQER